MQAQNSRGAGREAGLNRRVSPPGTLLLPPAPWPARPWKQASCATPPSGQRESEAAAPCFPGPSDMASPGESSIHGGCPPTLLPVPGPSPSA